MRKMIVRDERVWLKGIWSRQSSGQVKPGESEEKEEGRHGGKDGSKLPVLWRAACSTHVEWQLTAEELGWRDLAARLREMAIWAQS